MESYLPLLFGILALLVVAVALWFTKFTSVNYTAHYCLDKIRYWESKCNELTDTKENESLRKQCIRNIASWRRRMEDAEETLC